MKAKRQLGSGSPLAKYLTRPLLFSATILLAHLSTVYFERPMITLGRGRGGAPEGPASARMEMGDNVN